MQRPMRVYADTSVFGGAFDGEFATASQAFFDQVRGNRFHLISSALVVDELAEAPARVRSFFRELAGYIHIETISTEAVELRDAYLAAGIVGPASRDDAQHVALATVLDCWTIVSWNFRHIVHARKIPLYNGVNRVQGYTEIAIHTPQEVIEYENEEV
jgi:predicted nucleic acid-binding protein